MNEVLLRPHYNNDKPKQEIYFAAITRLAKSLDSLTRAEDPYRYTMIAHHGDYKRYRENGLIDIPMVVGWNLYSGWYGPRMEDFPVFLDAFHKDYPQKPIVVSEYGADADPRISSTDPVRFDKSVEYATRLHQYYMGEMMKRPFVAGAMIWNLADFNSETRTESMPHVNNKGLMEWDRTPKAPYYYYKAILSKTPFVKIITTLPTAGIADENKGTCTRILQAASNLDIIELIFNGKKMVASHVINGIAEWEVPFHNGVNSIEIHATKNGREYTDRSMVSFRLQPFDLAEDKNSFSPINVLLGANRYFIDRDGQVWMPDQEYKKGNWGFIGGSVYKIANNNRLPYGSDKNIMGTYDDPIYQTQRTGIEKYKLDLPKGEYEMKFHFAELQGGLVKELPYNLSDPDRIEPKGKRIFNMHINGRLVLDNFDIAAQYGPSTAVVRTASVIVTDTNGIEISFMPIEGAPVLNALQVTRIDKDQKAKTTNAR
jgi:beta-galactosidase